MYNHNILHFINNLSYILGHLLNLITIPLGINNRQEYPQINKIITPASVHPSNNMKLILSSHILSKSFSQFLADQLILIKVQTLNQTFINKKVHQRDQDDKYSLAT